MENPGISTDVFDLLFQALENYTVLNLCVPVMNDLNI